jgi:hypothetical protein
MLYEGSISVYVIESAKHILMTFNMLKLGRNSSSLQLMIQPGSVIFERINLAPLLVYLVRNNYQNLLRLSPIESFNGKRENLD